MELRNYFKIILRKKLIFFLIFFAVVGLPMTLSAIRPNIYKVTAKILIRNTANESVISETIPDKIGELKYIEADYAHNNFLKLFSDPNLVKELITSLDLDLKVEQFFIDTPYLSFLLSSTERAVNVVQMAETDIFEVNAFSTDPVEAGLIVNNYLTLLLERLSDLQKDAPEKLLPVLQEYQSLVKALTASKEKQLVEFSMENKITDPKNQMLLLFSRKDALEKEQHAQSIKIRSFETSQKKIRKILDTLPYFQKSAILVHPDPSIDIYATSIATMKMELAELRAEFTKDHFSIKALEKKIETAITALKESGERKTFYQESETVNPYHQTLTAQYWDNIIDKIICDATYRIAGEELEKINEKITRLSALKYKLTSLENKMTLLQAAEVSNSKDMLLSELLQSVDIPNAYVINRGDPQLARETAYFPKKGKTLIICCLIGFFLAFFSTLLLDYIDDRINSSARVAEIFQGFSIVFLPFMGWITRDRGKMRRHLWETARQIHASEEKILLISSSMNKEGKTTVGISLARTLNALGNRVLYIEMGAPPSRRETLGDIQTFSDTASVLAQPERLLELNDMDWTLIRIPANQRRLYRQTDYMEALEMFFERLRTVPGIDKIIIESSGLEEDVSNHMLLGYSDMVVFVLRLFRAKERMGIKSADLLNSKLKGKRIFIAANGATQITG